MKFKLKNGIVAEINQLSGRDKPLELIAFLASIQREKPKPFIRRNSVPSLSEEKKWLARELESQRKGEVLILVARVNGKIAGNAGAHREKYRDSDKVSLGISLAKPYRGVGLGKALLHQLVKQAKKRFKPRVIYLSCIGANKPAQKLYRKLGFREFARFKKWQKHRGKYEDVIFLKLGGKK